MTRIFLFVFLLFICASSSIAQKKYQGLLWEISGNGLTEPSYLYGTMHVSNKLAFNVSDSFYYCLDKVKGVALESSPQGWMEDYRDMGAFSFGNYSDASDFYRSAFKIEKAGSEIIYELLENKNGLMNQILYRFNPGNADYQENTYLDMFIFQAGAKKGKPIFSLETFDEVMKLSELAMTPDKDKKRDNSNNSYLESNNGRKYVMLEDAYRRGDLDQIDSLSKSNMPTSVYHHYFIVERNKNMVKRMDSIMQKQSLFTGIGAAHLPGEEGAIELLRDLGYSVRPVTNKSTGKSHKMRKKLEALYNFVDFNQASTSDNFLKVDVPGTLYEMPTNTRGKLEYLCPEPINGGYFSVIRLFTFGAIYNKTPEFYRETFDSLLYIATPGELLKKESITVNGHIGYNILTKTSKGAFVNYNVFFTPTEVIVIKGSGIGTYIQRSEPQTFFSKIQLSPVSSNWNEVGPRYGGVKWKMKGMVSGQDMIDGMDDAGIDPLYQSYDSEEKAFYLVMRYHYNDLDYIEEDSFDLAFLGEKYATQLGYKVESSDYFNTGTYPFVQQNLILKDENLDQVKSLKIKVLTRGGVYFLMSTTSASDSNSQVFFDSFEFTEHNLSDEYEIYTDTTLFYTVNTIKKDEKPGFGNMGFDMYRYYQEDTEDKSYLSETNTTMHYYDKTGESIWVGFTKFHDYEGADSLEQFWDFRSSRLAEEHKFILSRRQEKFAENGDPIINFILTDTGSSKGIQTQMRLHHGVLYTMQSLIDTVAGPSQYVLTFFESFLPADTLIGRDLFEDKAAIFIEHALGEDSLKRVNAMKSINKVDFKDKDVPGVIQIYNEYKFEKETETEYRENLIMAMGNREIPAAYNFLFEVFDSNNFNSDLQFIVLKSFSFTETEEAYNGERKLLLDNTPFTEKTGKLSFFDNLYDSLELAKNFYPDMLDLVVYPEYKPYVVELLAYGYLNEEFNFSHFSSKKSSIFRDAYIELKRTVANQVEEVTKKERYYYNSEFGSYHNLFIDYYALMCGFKKNGDKDTDKFFADIYRIKDKKFLIEAEIIHHSLGLPVDTSKINQVVNDREFRIWAYNRLDDAEMLEYFTPEITQEDMVFALLYGSGYDEEKDSVVFLKKVEVNNGKETGYVYFYKRKTEDTKNWMIDYIGLQSSDEKEFKTYGLDKKKSLAVKNDQEMELTIEKTIEIFELKLRKRVVATSGGGWGDWGGLF